MDDKAQFNFLLCAAKNLSSALLQKIIYSEAAVGENDFSKIFPSAPSHTTEIETSTNIDIQWDLELEPASHLVGEYDLFISASALEHVKKPWIAVKNMERVISKGSYL